MLVGCPAMDVKEEGLWSCHPCCAQVDLRLGACVLSPVPWAELGRLLLKELKHSGSRQLQLLTNLFYLHTLPCLSIHVCLHV
jgi:hypothetical protein